MCLFLFPRAARAAPLARPQHLQSAQPEAGQQHLEQRAGGGTPWRQTQAVPAKSQRFRFQDRGQSADVKRHVTCTTVLRVERLLPLCRYQLEKAEGQSQEVKRAISRRISNSSR